MIVVTGGAGFIGSNVVASLAERGEHDVVVVDRLRSGNKWRNVARHELTALVDPVSLLPWLDAHRGEVRAIVHLGAISATTETDADLIADTNIRLTLALWEWSARNGVRFLYASSAATYGDGAQGFDDDGSIEALSRLRPLNAYGWSKHLTDRRIARIVRDRGPTPPQWVGLKFFNVYGPNEYHKGEMRSVVEKTFRRVAAGEPALLFRSHDPRWPDGGQQRDFVYVRDCADLVLWMLDHPEVNGLYNCGTGRAGTFRELVDAVFAAVGRAPEVEWRDTPGEIRGKYQYFTEARMERVRAAGYDRPFRGLREGVRDYIEGWLATDDPWR